MVKGLEIFKQYFSEYVDQYVLIGGAACDEYLILFKAKAYMDLKERKESGEPVDSSDIKKHKKDVLRIAVEIVLEEVSDLSVSLKNDIYRFINSLEKDPFDANLLKDYGVNNQDVIDLLKRVF